MSDNVTTAICTVACVVGLLGLLAIGLKACADASTRYRAAQSECVTAGGTWVPLGQQSFDAACVMTGKQP